MGWMYFISGRMADYFHWWERRVEIHPVRWLIGLLVGGFIFTFLPAVVGSWAIGFWPIGWLCLPGLYAADKKIKHARAIDADQRAGVLRTKKLISLGQKEMKK